MKKISTIRFLGIFLALSYTSCQVDDADKAIADEQIYTDARAYVNKLIANAGAEVKAENPRAQLGNDLDWENAYLHELSAGTAVVVPIRYDENVVIKSNITNRDLKLNDYSRLLVYKDKDDRYHVEVVTMLPERGYSGRNDKPFAGVIYVEDWYGNLLKQYRHTQAGEKMRMTPVTNAELVSGRSQLMTVTICVTVSGWNYSAGDPNGYYWSSTSCNTYYFEDGGDGGGGYGGIGSGGGGSSGGNGGNNGNDDPCPGNGGGRIDPGQGLPGDDPQPPGNDPCGPVDIQPLAIVNDIANPCLNALVQEFAQKNTMTQLLFEKGFFTEHGNVGPFDIQYFEEDFSDPTTAADTKPQAGTNGYFKIITRFNTEVMPGASREYVMATLIHEMIHAYQGAFTGGANTEAEDHEFMAGLQMRNGMRDMLMRLCPGLSIEDANILTWGGLSKTTEYSKLSASYKEKIQNVDRDYRRGVKGKRCP